MQLQYYELYPLCYTSTPVTRLFYNLKLYLFIPFSHVTSPAGVIF